MRIAPVLLLATGLCLAMAPQGAQAAGFDGKWVAEIPKQGRCDIPGLMTIVVSGHDLSGEVHRTVGGDPKTTPITGDVQDNGHANFVAAGHAGTMTFSADHFEATWFNGYCDRHAQGDRALDAAGLSALAAYRRQRQAAYAELIRRAEDGDKGVDYTVLRSESVYASDWDFYGAKVSGLLDQAAAAVRGKDCAVALRTLDQVLKLDFTASAAHALRSDCLKQTGDPAKARIEADIAAGLTRSLMQSGRGDTEKAAYVVASAREENEVLVNRHLRIKTSQVEIRGSDGRYYDVIRGVSFSNGPLAGGPLVKSVYFDITRYMAGRASRTAAVATTQAALR
jgi:hypothetical protein